MTFFFVGRREKYHVFFMVICGSEEEIELFDGFSTSGLEWMTRDVTVVILQEASVTIADVAVETKNSPCYDEGSPYFALLPRLAREWN